MRVARVRVRRVSGMPHNVGVWVVDEDTWFTIYMDVSLITEEGALLLEGALSSAAEQAINSARFFARSS